MDFNDDALEIAVRTRLSDARATADRVRR